jgi:hypothetical protein
MCVCVCVCVYLTVSSVNQQVPLPVELLEHCRVISEGTQGWVWDYFIADLRSEYLDCRKDGVLPATVPIVQKVEVDGQVLDSPMHFDTAYYEDLHKKTLQCMQESIESLTVSDEDKTQVIKSIDLWNTLDYDKSGQGLSSMRDCMGKVTIADSSRCACGVLDSDSWPLPVFYVKKDEPTHRCVCV